MPPDGYQPGRPARAWLVVAAVLHITAMVLVMLALVRLTPLTMTFSVGAAGMLLAAACGIFVVGVTLGLRRREIL